MKYLRVTMPDESEWEVPASVIAQNRAEYYAIGPKAFEKALQETMKSHDTLKDWASDNMNWKDVMGFAKRIKHPEVPNYQFGWVNGPKEIVDHD
jgi:hypothetical protein